MCYLLPFHFDLDMQIVLSPHTFSERLEETEDELVKAKITLETEKQRKAAGVNVSAVADDLSLGTESLPPTDSVEELHVVRKADELEALPPTAVIDTGEGGEGGVPVIGAVNSPITKNPTHQLTRRSTLVSQGESLLMEQMVVKKKEWEGQ